MKIDMIAEYVWLNSQEIKFGESENWDKTLFKSKWAKGKPIENTWKGSSPGWYWILVDMNFDELCAVTKPSSLPKKGCNIGTLSKKMKNIFGESLLCEPQSGMTVIYNGHEADVTSRIRTHFVLNNNSTGAIGVIHYPLSSKKWSVRYFSSSFLNYSPDAFKSQIDSLINSYSGRCAVESAWRAKYGWPILCKE
ncbi:hypothetical protein [Aeromonas jandaei]|uniref:hypothetical protein n=1 Tax=Aeromonas jandaei TaxID=650 RepID=UPI0012DDCB7A|nr:hypothetical protein [Aeromonas jandaei]